MTDTFENAPVEATQAAESSAAPDSNAGTGSAERPAFIPAKFWDPRLGQVRVDALAKSYRTLERKLGAGDHLRASAPDPDDDGLEDDLEEDYPDDLEDLLNGDFDDTDLDDYLGDDLDADFDAVPDSPDDYRIEPGHPWLEVDPEVMEVLHDAGFSHEQAQVVYDLAATHVIPALEQVLGQAHRVRDEQQLAGYFGSSTRYEEAARQINDWASANLPPEVVTGLSSHPNGVIAMFRLMQSDEPRFLGSAGSVGQVGEADLKRLIADPKYWRDHDPATVRRVEDGFRRLYPERD